MSEDGKDNKGGFLDKPMTRWNFLKVAGLVALTLIPGSRKVLQKQEQPKKTPAPEEVGKLGNRDQEVTEKLDKAPKIEPIVTVDPVPTPTTYHPKGEKEITKVVEEPKPVPIEKPVSEERVTQLNRILATPLNTEIREQLEKRYAEQNLTLNEIDKGFVVLANEESRRALLNKRYDLRQKEGHKDLSLIPLEQVTWAEKAGIHPEAFGICLDAYPKAREIIRVLKSTLRDDLKDKPEVLEQLEADLFMINTGGMAALVREETDSFIQVGKVPAVDQLDPKEVPSGRDDLESLCREVSRDYGLNIKPENIPGSKSGAVGMQFMPPTALSVYQLFREYNEKRDPGKNPEVKFNPLDPASAVVGAWVFLARHENLGELGERYGYMRGDARRINFALEKWNDDPSEVKRVYRDAEDYWDEFLKGNLAA